MHCAKKKRSVSQNREQCCFTPSEKLVQELKRWKALIIKIQTKSK